MIVTKEAEGLTANARCKKTTSQTAYFSAKKNVQKYCLLSLKRLFLPTPYPVIIRKAQKKTPPMKAPKEKRRKPGQKSVFL
ncbi:MAG: hypothetical protein A2X59_01685 [Nitrospirae bacterium GWC2_42_7]|nr:MAG: hypothetical protein A2X59_01685 [Nitrospirae bacterium GWC2_42_7]HBO85184.1 hypothetical protein [Deltaproteobacteria bacterium]